MYKAFILLLFFLPLLAIGQKSEQEIEKTIKAISKKLIVLKTQLNKEQGEAQKLIKQLEQQDKLINDLSRAIDATKYQLIHIRNTIKNLEGQIKNKENSIEKQKGQIINLVKLQVYLNHDKTLKLILGTKQSKNNQQTKHQIKYLQNKLYSLIKSVTEEIKRLQQLNSKQRLLQKQENEKQQRLLAQQDNLFEERKGRLKILNNLKTEIAKHQSETQGLSKDQKRLRTLLDEIRHLLSDLPKNLGNNPHFYRLKGKLEKPLAGRYLHSFHSRRYSNSRWDGVVIAGTMGSKIKAIAYGRVAFADWLSGFGMLVIIDHQDGYMSLYGFNESLLVEVGDWVQAKQAIATVGNSGTLATPALYFEIRQDAKPLNPKSWLK